MSSRTSCPAATKPPTHRRCHSQSTVRGSSRIRWQNRPWLCIEFIVFRPSHMFLLDLPSGARRPEADLPNPLRSFDSLPRPKKLPPAPVIASQPHDFNIPDLTGTVCPNSSAGPESGHSAAVRQFLTSTVRCPASARRACPKP